MSAILGRIQEVGVQNKINMTEYEMGGGAQSSPLQIGVGGGGAVHTTVTMVWLIYMKNMERGVIQNSLEMFRNLKGT